MKNASLLSLTLCLLVACADKKATITADSTIPTPTNIFLTPEIMCGTVEFTDGCSPEMDTIIRFGIALIHHMTYEDAEYNFDQVITKDPDCFWGHWGKALSYIHPLWPDQLSAEQLDLGYTHSQKALALAKNEKEKLYGEALASFYQKNDITKAQRIAEFQKGWTVAHEQLPGDPEAELFHGLFTLATASPTDKSYTIQKEVGNMAERLLKKYPNHPGGFHYAIHAYDVPPMADRALKYAREYGKVAPEIPHALHMPSHIFTRMGLWDESIEWNTRSAKAALRTTHQNSVSTQAFHAMDYMTYAYLQKGEDDKALEIWNSLDTLTHTYEVAPATAYAIGAMPGRIALERQNWQQAANVPEPDTNQFAWNKFPQYKALRYYTRGIGSARMDNVADAHDALAHIDDILKILGSKPENKYWYDQVMIQKLAVSGWIAYASNDKSKAIDLLKQAADLEDGTTKNPVTPGELLPAREQLGDLYLELKMPKEALEAYQTSLASHPNRYNTLYGAGKAAEGVKNTTLAKEYFSQLKSLIADNHSKRERSDYAINASK